MNRKGYIYAVLSAVFFGTSGLFIKTIYKFGIDSISLIILQYLIAVIIMAMVSYINDRDSLRVNKVELFHLMVLGVIGNTFMTVFYYKAFVYLPVSVVTLLLYTYPALVFIYSIIFNKEKVTIKKLCALIMAFIGCIFTLNIIGGKVVYSIIGIVYGLLSAVFYTFINLYSEKKLRNVKPLAINLYSTIFSLSVLIIYQISFLEFQQKFDLKCIPYIIILAIFCEIVPLTLLYTAIKYIGSVKVSIISNLEIPTAMVISIVFLYEKITFVQFIGSVLIIYAAYLIKRDDKI